MTMAPSFDLLDDVVVVIRFGFSAALRNITLFFLHAARTFWRNQASILLAGRRHLDHLAAGAAQHRMARLAAIGHHAVGSR